MKFIKLSSATLWILLLTVFYFPGTAFAATQIDSPINAAGVVDLSDWPLDINMPLASGLSSFTVYTCIFYSGTNLGCQARGSGTWHYRAGFDAFGGTAPAFDLEALEGSHGDGVYRITTNGAGDVYPGYDAGLYAEFTRTSGAWSYVASDTHTRIISVTPAASSTIATSSAATLGASIYVNPTDYQDGMFVEIKYVYQANALYSTANTQALWTYLNFPITHAGSSNLSTTTPVLRVGRYTMVTTMRDTSLLNSALNFLGFGQFANFNVLTATTTTFVASTTNAYDNLTDSMINSIQGYLASSTISLASCNDWTHLNLVDCMNLLFVPQWGPIKDAVDNFRQGFLSYWPWGYITRVAVIMSGSATTTLPAFSVDFANVLPPGTATDNYTLDMNDMLAGGAAALNGVQARGGTANEKDILEPILRTFLALLIVMMIVRDLTKIGSSSHHNSASARGHV